jgi:hypothetical protein
MLDGDFEVDGFGGGEGGGAVGEAEGVGTGGLGGEDVVALALRGFGQDCFVEGGGDEDVDVECAAGLDLGTKGRGRLDMGMK